jgi:hypothetical protein
MLIDIILRTKRKLVEEGVPPPHWMRLSRSAHDQLVDELNRRNGGKAVRLFEILGMKVDIDPDCPPQTGYAGGKDENWKEGLENVLRGNKTL